MIKHKLLILGDGHDPRPEVNDFEVVHIIYQLDTIEEDSDSGEVLKYASSGAKVLELTPWNAESKITGIEVTRDILEQWVSESVNLDRLKEINIANLQPIDQLNTLNTTRV